MPDVWHGCRRQLLRATRGGRRGVTWEKLQAIRTATFRTALRAFCILMKFHRECNYSLKVFTYHCAPFVTTEHQSKNNNANGLSLTCMSCMTFNMETFQCSDHFVCNASIVLLLFLLLFNFFLFFKSSLWSRQQKIVCFSCILTAVNTLFGLGEGCCCLIGACKWEETGWLFICCNITCPFPQIGAMRHRADFVLVNWQVNYWLFG